MIKDAMKFFFEAMRKGWVGEGRYINDMPLPGWNTFTYLNDSWYLSDMYHTTPDSIRSSGVTNIYWKRIPVWVMHYGGGYQELAIPTLKLALGDNYQNQLFIGGRGPTYFRNGRFQYTNDPVGTGEMFTLFKGTEQIIDTETLEKLGSHWYNGEWLLD